MATNIKEKNNFIISSYQSEIKKIKKEKENLEIANQNQKLHISSLKNIILNYEKELSSKDNNINELKQKVEELNKTIKNMKEEIKKEKNKEIMKLNEKINHLQNILEIKDEKTELNNKKYNTLQIKYLKMLHTKKKSEQDNLLKQSINLNLSRKKKRQITIKKMKQNLSLNSIYNDIDNNNNINYNKINNDNINFEGKIILPLLKDKNISRYNKNSEEVQIKKENKGNKNDLNNTKEKK